jgi:hypothetical protein
VRDPAIFIIRYGWRNNSVLFVHNLDEKPREISFAVGLPGETGNLLVNLLTEDHSRAGARGRHRLLMEGYGYRWYRVGGLDYLLKRSDIDTKTTEKASPRLENDSNDRGVRRAYRVSVGKAGKCPLWVEPASCPVALKAGVLELNLRRVRLGIEKQRC